MTFKHIFFPVVLFFFLFSVAFAEDATVVCVVNGTKIMSTAVEAVIKQAVESGQEDTPELRKNVKEQLIYQEVLFQEADKSGIGKKTDIKEQLDQARKSILIRGLFIEFLDKNPITDADIQGEYTKSKAAVAGEKEYSARHILVDTEDEAKAVLAKLKTGAKFEELAKQSKDPGSAENGGLLDWAPTTNYVGPFAGALKALKKGETTSAPVKTQFGFHVIRLEDSREIKFPALDDIKSKIVQTLQRKKLETYQDGLRNKAKIQ